MMEKKFLVISNKVGEFFDSESDAQARAHELSESMPGWKFYFTQTPVTFECTQPKPKLA